MRSTSQDMQGARLHRRLALSDIKVFVPYLRAGLGATAYDRVKPEPLPSVGNPQGHGGRPGGYPNGKSLEFVHVSPW